jgi:hypothetical protein
MSSSLSRRLRICAAIGLLLGEVLDGLENVGHHVADAADADDFAAAVSQFEHHAAIHEAAFLGLVVDFGIALAVAGGGDLIRRGAVLHQESFDRLGARHGQFIVVGRRTDDVGIAGDLELVVLVLVIMSARRSRLG